MYITLAMVGLNALFIFSSDKYFFYKFLSLTSCSCFRCVDIKI